MPVDIQLYFQILQLNETSSLLYGTVSWNPGEKNSDIDYYRVELRNTTVRVKETTYSVSRVLATNSIVLVNDQVEITASISAVHI